MDTIRLSTQLINAYREKKVNLSYAICELLGYVDIDSCSKMSTPPMQQYDAVEYPLDSAALDALKEKFDHVDSYGEIAEILLWSNYWMGGRL